MFLCFSLAGFYSHAQMSVRGGLLKNYSGNPGESFEIKIPVFNTSHNPEVLTTELKDVRFHCDAKADYSIIDRNKHRYSAVDWVSDFEYQNTVNPKEKFEFIFNVKIPNDPDLKGTYYFIFQFVNPVPEKDPNSKQSITLLERTSYSVGILIDVNKDSEMDLNFEKMDIAYNSLPDNTLQKELNVTLSNNNLFYYTTRLRIEVYDGAGDLILEKSSKRKNIYPASCREISLDVSELKKGDYQCVLLAEADEEMVGTNLSLHIDQE